MQEQDTTSQGKRCPKCGTWKPYSEYHKNRSTQDGYQSYCKPCFIALNKASRERNLEVRRAHMAEYQRGYQARDHEAQLQRNHDWYARKGYDYHHQWKDEHRESVRASTRKWQQKEKNSQNAIFRRRAKKVGNGGNHTEAQWQALAASYDFCCARCGKRPSGIYPDVLCRDHVVPLILGGTHDISNIQPLCLPCNASKGRRTVDYRREANQPPA